VNWRTGATFLVGVTPKMPGISHDINPLIEFGVEASGDGICVFGVQSEVGPEGDGGEGRAVG
jgi:hypothetical protein